MDISQTTENSVVTGSDGGRNITNIIYILYIVGFFVAFTALIGVILAYVNRATANEPFKSHLNFQIKIFWRGIVYLASSTVLYLIISAIGIATSGLGFLLFVIPIALGLWWLVWTIMAIAKGMGALGRHEKIPG